MQCCCRVIAGGVFQLWSQNAIAGYHIVGDIAKRPFRRYQSAGGKSIPEVHKQIGCQQCSLFQPF